jgi:GNAT superfamily N-acetyltransferase
MYKLPKQSDEKLMNDFGTFNWQKSEAIGKSCCLENMSINKCLDWHDTNVICYWIGRGDQYFSYLAVRPVTYGNCTGYTAFRIWTDPEYRNKGLGSELLRYAVKNSKVYSDEEGMSEDSFNLINSQRYWSIRYYDLINKKYVKKNEIDEQYYFSEWDQGKQWIMELKKENKVLKYLTNYFKYCNKSA